MEIGAFAFADVSVKGGVTAPQRIPELIEEIVLADEVGLDVFGLGEHHHPAFGAPAPAVTLAAAAARTSRIRLSSAVTVLSTADPVRVLEEFTALDLVSGGRAELMVGRGALFDSFRLFGHDVQDYERLLDEKLHLLLRLRADEPVTWSGRFRPPLHGETVLPRPVQHPLPVSVAVGGSPRPAVRAAAVGLPLVIGTLAAHRRDPAPLPGEGRASSEIVRSHLPGTARLVKTLNHIGYHEIEELARPAGAPGRIALGVAGADPPAVAAVAAFVDRIGSTPVVVGGLADSAVLQPGSALFGADLTESELRRELAAADAARPSVP
jgi:hypothetical protein